MTQAVQSPPNATQRGLRLPLPTAHNISRIALHTSAAIPEQPQGAAVSVPSMQALARAHDTSLINQFALMPSSWLPAAHCITLPVKQGFNQNLPYPRSARSQACLGHPHREYRSASRSALLMPTMRTGLRAHAEGTKPDSRGDSMIFWTGKRVSRLTGSLGPEVESTAKGTRELFWVMNVFCNWAEEAVSRTSAFVRTHWTVHLQRVPFILCRLSRNIVSFKRKNKMDVLVTGRSTLGIAREASVRRS